MAETISSLQNSKVKYLRSLYRKKYRREEEQFVLEGSRIISDALQAGVDIKQVFYSDQFLYNQANQKLLEQLQAETTVFELTDSLLDQVADTTNPQGIIAVVDYPQFNADEFLAADNDFFLVVDQIQDPGNLGTILRTADGAGVDGVFLLKGTVDLYNLKTVRATMGSLFRLPVFKLESPNQLAEVLQSQDVQLVVGDIEADDYYYELDYSRPTAVVVGNEGNGPQAETLSLADQKIKVPLAEGIDSLNAAIASGVIMYEVVRQRQIKSL
ncbi:MAG: TrmH family RNA methyltransferase [Bacillota bacterium]